MDRKSVLKDLSAADLRQELVNRLREQLYKHEQEAEALRDQIRQLMPDAKTVSTGRSGRGSRTLVKNGMSLREIIVQVLGEAGEALRIKEVIERVKAAGYVSKATNFASIVNISLAQNQELFEKVGRGVYKLRDGAAVPQQEEKE